MKVKKRICDCCGMDVYAKYTEIKVIEHNVCAAEFKTYTKRGTIDLCRYCKEALLLMIKNQRKFDGTLPDD